jgi:hypothetical protein
MALNKTTLENGLKALFVQMKTSPSDDALAHGIAELIDAYVKGATVSGNAHVSTSGQLSGPADYPVAGTLS